jgi:hypothetical protein
MMEPVMVWVVETGAPEAVDGFKLGHFHSQCFDDAPAPAQRPHRDREMAAEDDPEGDMEFGAEAARAEKKHGDDPHRLLGVVRAVTQAVQGSRDELEPTERSVHGPQ